MKNIQKSAFYNGITFVDVDDMTTLPTDFECDRIPNKGDIMCFKSIIDNDTTYYHCEVLYIYDSRTGLNLPIEEMEILNTSIFVVTQKINPRPGNGIWKSIKNILKQWEK